MTNESVKFEIHQPFHFLFCINTCIAIDFCFVLIFYFILKKQNKTKKHGIESRFVILIGPENILRLRKTTKN